MTTLHKAATDALRALELASSVFDAVPSQDRGHLGSLVNAQTDGTHGYRFLHDALDGLRAALSIPDGTHTALLRHAHGLLSIMRPQTTDVQKLCADIDSVLSGQAYEPEAPSQEWLDVAAAAMAQEPVLYRFRDSESCIKAMPGYTPPKDWEPLYTRPAPAQRGEQRQWRNLSDKEIIGIAKATQSAEPGRDGYILPITFAGAVSDALRTINCQDVNEAFRRGVNRKPL